VRNYHLRDDLTGQLVPISSLSTSLLRNNKKCNELEDDRESYLHMLTWTALRFTKHMRSEGDSSMFLRAFDEEYEDEEGVKGGDLKRGFLATREIPHVVKFDRRPHLDKLIRELTEAFAVRYEEPPSNDHVQGLERARKNNVDPSIMPLLPAFDYQKCLDDLAAPNWLVDTSRCIPIPRLIHCSSRCDIVFLDIRILQICIFLAVLRQISMAAHWFRI